MTTQIAEANLNGVWNGVFYSPLGKPVFSVNRVQRAAMVFVSSSIDGTSDLISWKDLSWSATVPSGTTLYFYTRSAGTEAALEEAEWEGPILNASGESLSSLTGRLLQVRMVACSSYESGSLSTPSIDYFKASCHLGADEEKFFTEYISLGFKPEHILLTYNGTVPDGALVRFAVTGIDNPNESEYQFVDVNSVERLDQISELSDGIKVMVSGISSKEIPFEVDEFSIVVSGDGQTKTNK